MASAAAASVTPAVMSTQTAQAAAPMSGKPAPSFYRFKVGEFEVTTVNDGVVKIANTAALVPTRSPDEINKALDDAMIPRDNLLNPFTPVVVNTGKNLVLIDTGWGDNGPATVGTMMSNLAAAGIDPKDVDTILITHFHLDHISGIRAKAGTANFPNAEIIVAADEWKFWNDESEASRAADMWKNNFAAIKRVFGPIAKDVKQIAYGKEVVPGITAVDSRGHSPGHTSYMLSSGNSTLLVLGDVTNNPALFARYPEWRLFADMVPDQALEFRRKLLDMASADKIPVIGYHYAFPAAGCFAKSGNGYTYFPVIWQTTL